MKILMHLKFFFSSAYWQKNWNKVVSTFFTLLSIELTIVEIVNLSFEKSILFGKLCLIIIGFIVTLLFSIIFNYQRLEFKYKIKNKDINICLVIGDIFNQDGDIGLVANTTFDTTFDNGFISENSIQGILTEKIYKKNDYLDADIQRSINEYGYEIKEVLSDGRETKRNRYEFGTVIKLTHEKFKSYWIAMADVNKYGKPSSSMEIMQQSLDSFWNFLLERGHMGKLVLPILGSGKTGINRSRSDLLKEIVYSFMAFSADKKIVDELVICVHPDDFINHKFDILEIQRFLDYCCQYLYDDESRTNGSVGIE